MTDYFFDFTSGTNGNGTSVSPWNQCTAAETTTISGGDNLWFRRCQPADNTKLIVFKAGDSNESRINYIGWPMIGDEFYNTRPSMPTWDQDASLYLYQSANNNQYTAVITLQSNINLHRIYSSDNYGNANYGHQSLAIITKSNVTLKNCRLYATSMPDTVGYWYAGLSYLDNAFNILFENTIFDGAGGSSYRMVSLYNIRNSTPVTFSGCTFYFGTDSWANEMNISYFDDTDSSYVERATLNFINCTMYNRLNVANHTSPGFYYSGLTYINGSAGVTTVTVSGCNIIMDNTTDTTTKGFPSYAPLAFFRVKSANFSMYNTTITSYARQQSVVLTEGTSNILLDTINWTVSGRPINILVDLRGYTTCTLNNITGTLYEGVDKDINNVNYLLAFSNWDYIFNDVLSLNNVLYHLGYILELTRDAAPRDINISSHTYAALQHNTVYITRMNSLTFNNSNIAGFRLHDYSANSGNYVYGGYIPGNNISLKNSNINNVPLQLDNTYSQQVNALVYNCVGAGTVVFNDNGTPNPYVLNLKAVRNTGFTTVGAVREGQGVEVYAVLNNFNNGTTFYTSNLLTCQTSTVNKTGGAGYSVQIIKKAANNVEVTYPKIGDDTTWVYLPAAGTYTVTLYIKYSCSVGYSLVEGDVRLGMDYINGNSVLVYSDTYMVDNSSTWSALAAFSEALQLSCTVTVTAAQYCPVRLYIYATLPSLTIYFDPKLAVIAS